MKIQDCFYYDETSPTCLRRVVQYTSTGKKSSYSDRPAGTLNSYGYYKVEFNGKSKFVHRLIYVMHFGPIPHGMNVDHKDNNPKNNKIDNLRLASFTQNNQNSLMKKTNKSGVKGVCWNRMFNKWVARINHGGKYIYVGSFHEIKDAKAAIDAARIALHGEFANDGIIKKGNQNDQ